METHRLLNQLHHNFTILHKTESLIIKKMFYVVLIIDEMQMRR